MTQKTKMMQKTNNKHNNKSLT